LPYKGEEDVNQRIRVLNQSARYGVCRITGGLSDHFLG
jgi:hypothetical protein